MICGFLRYMKDPPKESSADLKEPLKGPLCELPLKSSSL